MKHYQCCSDLLTMKLDHYSSHVSLHYRALTETRMVNKIQ